jgi:LDH2 family malate/lactate/ureidoglycolate dehydrogenase
LHNFKMAEKDSNIAAERLYAFTKAVFIKVGMAEGDAETASRVLLSADLRGIDSHGVARLSGYIRLWEAGRLNTNPQIKIIHETPSTATVDADAAAGLVSGAYAMEVAIKKAETCGTGWVSVMNSNHFGIAAYHALKAIPHDMIGIAMTNASPLVAPTFSIERMLGTNPMCFAIPAKNHPPIVVDLATSAAANGKLEIAQREGKSIPKGWVQTKDGNESTDANELKNGGSLLPLGSNRDLGSHKGFGLAAVVDIFSAVLSGANYGPWVPPFVSFLPVIPNSPGKGIGHFFGAMRIDAFRPKEDFYHHIGQWIERFKAAQTSDSHQSVVIPGEPEAAHELIRREKGIPVNNLVIQDLEALAIKLNLRW